MKKLNPSTRKGFTLIEVILVLVLVLVVSSISLPYFAGSLRGSKLRTAAQTISRMAKYGRNMAIMREETLTMVLNNETMEVYLGGETIQTNSAADGELDQDVLKRLGYTDDGGGGSDSIDVEKEVHRFLPDDLTVRTFEKDWELDEKTYENLYLIRYYPNGQCDWFELELEDKRGMIVKLKNDPISGKVTSEFVQ
jgi:general secretion pathway protein H